MRIIKKATPIIIETAKEELNPEKLKQASGQKSYPPGDEKDIPKFYGTDVNKKNK